MTLASFSPVRAAGSPRPAAPNPDPHVAMRGASASAGALCGGVLVFPLTSAHGRRCAVVLGEPDDWSGLRLLSRMAALAAATWGGES